MDKKTNYITTAEAMQIASEKGVSVTLPTIINWCDKYSIGKKIFGRWQVDKDKLLFYLER